MSKGKLLVVDDEEEVRHLITEGLTQRGYEVVPASSGEEALEKVTAERPDIVILDVDMPGMDGIQTCREIRRSLFMPIILLSAHCEETDIVLGLGVGADNYLIKPFRMPVLLAYIDAAIRRQMFYSQSPSQARFLRVKDLVLDISAHELRRNRKTVPLTQTEFRLFQTLAQNAGRVLTRDQLLDNVWEVDSDSVYSRTVDVHIGRMRRKIGDNPSAQQYIVTVRGLGYKMPSA